ncbi:MAG: glycosyltransferase family 4 protein [Parvularculaceae bacterium]|nr:glycosyltransferase family 4 protein [Parvularculaceae bacterium]
MRILYSHRTKSADGQYVHIRALTEALKARGDSLFMAGPDDWGETATRALDGGGPGGGVRRIVPKPIYEIAELGYSLPAYRRLARAARLFRPDVLYERYNLFYHAGVRLSRARAMPMILEVNAPLVDERSRFGGLALKSLARWSETSIWRAADAVLPVTGVLARLVEAAGVAPERIHVIQNGVEAEQLLDHDPRPVRARYGLDGRLVLGFAGFVRDWHRVERVIDWMARSPRRDLHLLLVGDGDVVPELKARAAERGIANRFTVTGVVQRPDVTGHIAAFDIALQPAATPYASPLKQFEYMALGKAIVAPAQPNIAEILADGADALLFAPDDEAALGAALTRLVEDAELRRRLGAAAKATLLRRDLTWSGNARRVEEIAARLLVSRPS